MVAGSWSRVIKAAWFLQYVNVNVHDRGAGTNLACTGSHADRACTAPALR